MRKNPDHGDSVDSDQRSPARQWLWRLLGITLVGASLTQLSGCLNTAPQKADGPKALSKASELPCGKPQALPTNLVVPAKQNTPAADEDPDLWARLRDNYRLWDVNNPRVQAEIRRLQHSPSAFNALISRAEPYLYHILNEVEKRQLPGELALLPAVESGFRPYAYSPDGAAGLWQFMPATGSMLGLKQDWWYDGRRDVLAGTNAALDYLEHLNNRLNGNWLHTIAAYNAGGGAVSHAIRKAKRKGASTSFWDLDLPRETDSYVPRLLALAEVISDPGRYGLALPSLQDRPYFEAVASGGQIDLKVASDLARIPMEDLLVLNPGFNRWSTRPQGPHHLLIPLEQAQTFRTALQQLPAEKRLRWQYHQIRSGENLGRIARQYSVSVQAIQQVNGLENHRIRAGKTLMIPLSDNVLMASFSRKLGMPRTRVRYQVRKGDSLYKIARKFRVKIADLRRWNSVGRYIKPGQRLTVYVDPTRQTL